MAQAYRTTYNISFRWKDIKEGNLKYDSTEDFCSSVPAGDYWILPKSQKEEDIDEEAYEAIARLYEKRNTTVYQRDYCHKLKPIHEKVAEEYVEGVSPMLLETGAELYDDKAIKVLPPLSTTRRLYGYLSPSAMFTPLTTYQNHIGKLGYERLKSNNQNWNDVSKDQNASNDEVYRKISNNNKNSKDDGIINLRNFTVQVNGKDLTIKRTFDSKSKKLKCECI